MVDDRPEATGPSPDTGRIRREPPTIDLEATEVSAETAAPAPGAEPEKPSSPRPAASRSSAALISAISGASAAALVLGVAWFAGWPATPAPAPAPQINSAAIDDLAARLASVEVRVSKPPAAATPDPAAAARADAVEKSLAALRGELATQRAQSDKLAAAISDVKSAPREAAPALISHR